MNDRPAGPSPPQWDAARIRRLRRATGANQQAFAERLGTRQQTVSEWERGVSRPRRMAQRLLGLIAEEHAGYDSGDSGDSEGRDDAGGAGGLGDDGDERRRRAAKP